MIAIGGKKKKNTKLPKGAGIFKQMLEDKKAIKRHLREGGTVAQLKEKGYRFAIV